MLWITLLAIASFRSRVTLNFCWCSPKQKSILSEYRQSPGSRNRRSPLRAAQSGPRSTEIPITCSFHSAAVLLDDISFQAILLRTCSRTHLRNFPMHPVPNAKGTMSIPVGSSVTSDAVLSWQPATERVSHDNKKFVHPFSRSFWIVFSCARFDDTFPLVVTRVQTGKAELNSDDVVTLSNERLMTRRTTVPSGPKKAGCWWYRDTEHPLGQQSQPFQATYRSFPSGKSFQTPATFSSTSRTKHARWETETASDIPSPLPLHTSCTVICIGVSSYLLHSSCMTDVGLHVHARSTMRCTTNSVSSKHSTRLNTMESTL